MPNPLLGQHFLRNPRAVKMAIDAIDPQHGETVIEIGPGHGELTIPLAERCRKSEAKLIIIEKDAGLIGDLKKRLTNNDIEVITGDALRILTKLPLKNHKIVGNIPYYLTGKLLRIISELDDQPKKCVFMMQEEVVERIMAQPPRMNRLAASVQIWAAPKIIMKLSKDDFYPAPKIDSALIELQTKSSAADLNATSYYAAVRAIFAQPRKTLLNNLSAAKKDLAKDEIAVKLKSRNLESNIRPQDLQLADIQAIAESFWG